MSNTILCKEGYLIPKIDKYTEIIKTAMKELTVEPYVFMKKKQDIQFKIYQENDEYISVPKYYGLEKFGKPDLNKEINGETINITFKGELRSKQKEIIDSILPHLNTQDGGVLCLPCAAGKTVLALYLISLLKVKTLVIVHKTFLLNQWKDRASEFTDAKIGIIQQNKIDIDGKDIVIGMLQSIAKDKYESSMFKDFGLVIFDEAHHAPSEYFSKALPIIAAKKMIGLSATPKRVDGLEKILYWYFNKIMYKLNVESNNNVLVNIINYNIQHEKFKEFYMYSGEVNRAKMITKIGTIGRRNKFIVSMIENVLKEEGRKVLILSDRLEHLKLLKNRLDELNCTTSDFYIGGKSQKLLDIAKTAQVIFASYGMASEGLDIPELNTLFMVSSRKEVEQSVGRVVRKINPNIRPMVFDFTDQLPSFINQGRHRQRLFKKQGFEIKIIQVENNKIINETQTVDICENVELDETTQTTLDFID
jgi:superfamily II DNA or RNA helicase